MFDNVTDWIGAVLPEYVLATGSWIEGAENADDFFVVVKAEGGPSIDVDDRRPRYKITLLGPRNGVQYKLQVMQAAESLVIAALGGSLPCDAAGLQVASEPMGPGFTTENRAYASVVLQVTF